PLPHQYRVADSRSTHPSTLPLRAALPIATPSDAPASRAAPSARPTGSATCGTLLRRACLAAARAAERHLASDLAARSPRHRVTQDRKSTRLNSSHVKISYAVFGSKKKVIDKIHRQALKTSHMRQSDTYPCFMHNQETSDTMRRARRSPSHKL